MTLLIATKLSSKDLAPDGQPIELWDGGVVMVADTRFTGTGGGPEDDGQKLWPLNDVSFAGFTGDIQLAEYAILSTMMGSRAHGRRNDPNFARNALKSYLMFWATEIARSRKCKSLLTTLLVALRKPEGKRSSRNRFQLYRVGTRDNFKWHELHRSIVVGSGTVKGTEVFRREASFWADRRAKDCTANNPAKITALDVAGLIGGVVDKVVEEAEDVAVGGKIQIMTIDENGMWNPGLKIIDRYGKSRDGTQEIFRSYVDMFNDGSFKTPSCTDRGHIEPKAEDWTITTSPGYLTGQKLKSEQYR